LDTLQISMFGDPAEVVERVEVPEPGEPKANEALVALEYSPINYSDLLTIRGWYGVRPALPSGIGNEGVGRVLAVGEGVDYLRVGDRVVVSTPRCAAANNEPFSPSTRR
jgi:NADPH:quinone reductase-like Zn-dependent oxidoreductase